VAAHARPIVPCGLIVFPLILFFERSVDGSSVEQLVMSSKRFGVSGSSLAGGSNYETSTNVGRAALLVITGPRARSIASFAKATTSSMADDLGRLPFQEKCRSRKSPPG